MHCRLLVPHFLPFAASGKPLREILPEGLSTLLKYGIIARTPGKSFEGWLCTAFGVEYQQDYPVAPFSLLGDGGTPGDHYWLRADPVTIQLMRNRLVLLAAAVDAPSPVEAAELIEALNQHFLPDGLQFSAPHPSRWYLRLSSPPRLRTHSLAQANGRNIQHFLPSGEDSPYWRRLLNEIQILLHAHPINIAREAVGKPTLNSIWPWGGGMLTGKLSTPYSQIIADDPLARGLAIAVSRPWTPLPSCFPSGAWQFPDTSLFVLEAMYNTPQQCLEQWDGDWFKPALAALRQGKIKRLDAVFPDQSATLEVTLTRLDLWKFWRGATRLELNGQNKA